MTDLNDKKLRTTTKFCRMNRKASKYSTTGNVSRRWQAFWEQKGVARNQQEYYILCGDLCLFEKIRDIPLLNKKRY